jgi:hypothetical protein
MAWPLVCGIRNMWPEMDNKGKSERLGNKMMRVSAGSQYGSLTSPTYFRMVTSVTILLCFHAVYILMIACNRAARPNRDLKSLVRESRAY